MDSVVISDRHVHFDEALRRGDEWSQRDLRSLNARKQPDQNIQFTQRNQSVCCCDPKHPWIHSLNIKYLKGALLNLVEYMKYS